MREHTAIFRKQLLDTARNGTILLQFLMFPILTIVMDGFVHIDGMPDHFFVIMFSPMYVGMAPLISMSSVVAEEKERNTLRVLLMNGVKPFRYLLGVGTCIFAGCAAGSLIMLLSAQLDPQRTLACLGMMAAGIILSILLGASIGVLSKDQMSATSLAVPCMLVLSFLPMFGMFNADVAAVSKYVYTGQISDFLADPGASFGTENVLILIMNAAVLALLFWFVYKKRGLD